MSSALSKSAAESLAQSRFMKAVRREPVDTVPIWIMRQAGRYLPEYRAVRDRVSFIELCKSPQLAAEVTLTAQAVLGVDAAILFADLLPILEPMGFHLEYQAGEGPVIHNPLRSAADVDRVKPLDNVDEMDFVFDAVKLIRRDLPADIPLLGFAGAPFTLASYVIEGGSSRNYFRTKGLMYNDPAAWDTLLQRLVQGLIGYVNRQIECGCQAVQIFDSWAGCLSPADYRRYVMPHTQRLIQGIHGAPVINFLTGNPALLELQVAVGGEVIGLDWRMEIDEARRRIGPDRAVQGNLDPAYLTANLTTLKEETHRVLRAAGPTGHIFNLGHGVTPDVSPDHVKALVQMVHEWGAARTR